MASTQDGGFITRPAGADLSSSQYRVVKLSSGEFVLCSAGSDVSIGVLQNAPVENDTAVVLGRHASETGKVVLGTGGASAGQLLTADSNGAAVDTTTEDDHVFGIALEDGDAGDIIEFMPVYDVIPPAS